MVEASRRTTTKLHGKVAKTIYTSPVNWEFAQSMDLGGASAFIHKTLSDMRRKHGRAQRNNEAAELRTRIAELEGMVNRLGGNPYVKDYEQRNKELDDNVDRLLEDLR